MYSVPGLFRPVLTSSPYWSNSSSSRDMVLHAKAMRSAKKRKAAFVAAQQVLPFEGTGSYVIPVQSLTGETPASVLPVFSAS